MRDSRTRTRRRGLALAALSCILFLPSTPGPCRAETPVMPPDSVLAAVGWLGWGDPSRAHAGCTGALVAPDLVLTAAHCVTDDERTPPANPAAILFLAGRFGSGPAPPRHGRAVILTAPRVLLDGQMPYDLALVRLDAPVADVAPLPIADASLVGGTAVIVGYPVQAAGGRDIVTGCNTRGIPGVIMLSCAARPGYSGGPVLVPDAGTWRILATLVARSRSGALPEAFAVIPADDLRRAIAAR